MPPRAKFLCGRKRGIERQEKIFLRDKITGTIIGEEKGYVKAVKNFLMGKKTGMCFCAPRPILADFRDKLKGIPLSKEFLSAFFGILVLLFRRAAAARICFGERFKRFRPQKRYTPLHFVRTGDGLVQRGALLSTLRRGLRGIRRAGTLRTF